MQIVFSLNPLHLLHAPHRTGKIPLELSRLPHLSGVYLYNNCFESKCDHVVCGVPAVARCAGIVRTAAHISR